MPRKIQMSRKICYQVPGIIIITACKYKVSYVCQRGIKNLKNCPVLCLGLKLTIMTVPLTSCPLRNLDQLPTGISYIGLTNPSPPPQPPPTGWASQNHYKQISDSHGCRQAVGGGGGERRHPDWFDPPCPQFRKTHLIPQSL